MNATACHWRFSAFCALCLAAGWGCSAPSENQNQSAAAESAVDQSAVDQSAVDQSAVDQSAVDQAEAATSEAPERRADTAGPSQRDALLGGWLSSSRIIDLSHSFDETTIYWPTEKGFRLERGTAGYTERGYYYSANRFAAAEHGGTHIDAPIHFAEGRATVDAIPLHRLIGEGALVDVSAKCEKFPDYQIDVGDLQAWERQQGRPLIDVILLLRTGFARHWPDREKYLGTAATGSDAVARLHFPGLAPEAAKWLVDHRAVKAVGIDTASIDFGQSRLFQSHVTLFKGHVPAFENIAAMEELPAVGFLVVGLPMKIGGGSGGPLRIVAVVAE